MANFGFAHLTVVAPYGPHWREARSAVGAPELLQNAKETETLAQAVASCTFVAGTGTLAHRKPEQPVIFLPDSAPTLTQELDRGGRIALVFGPAKHGLTRDDLSVGPLAVYGERRDCARGGSHTSHHSRSPPRSLRENHGGRWFLPSRDAARQSPRPPPAPSQACSLGSRYQAHARSLPSHSVAHQPFTRFQRLPPLMSAPEETG
jgi:hypothetical protein